MICAWKELISILPVWLRGEIREEEQSTLQEIRLRINAPPELISRDKFRWLKREVSQDDLNFCINSASRYSPWAAATMAQGFLTAQGGHRIGLCGQAVCKEGQITGFREVSSLCIRIARDFPGISAKAASISGSVLILGPPGWGKTTLLRDLIRLYSDRGQHICVVDERGELFPGSCFPKGSRTDVLTGCPKEQGVDIALRTMGPDAIAVDEITAEGDCLALIRAGWCGVRLLATAHASDLEDLHRRQVYKPLAESRIFQTVLILHADKSWRTERMEP